MNKTDTTIACLLSIVLAAFLVPFAVIGVDPHHDGIMLKPALDVLSGQVLFRDTFMQYGALTCYLQALALWIHPTLLAIKLMMVAVYAITLFFLYGVWRMLLPPVLTVCACGLYALFIPFYEIQWKMIPWSSEFAMMFQVVALYALGQLIRGRQPAAWAMMLGLSSACIFWCRQPVGILTCGALFVIGMVLLRTGWVWPEGSSKRGILTPMALGFVSVNALLLGGISLSGALSSWWYQNFTWPRQWAMQGGERNWDAWAPTFLHWREGLGLLTLLLALAVPELVNRIKPVFSRNGRVVYYAVIGGIMILNREWLGSMLSWPEGGWPVAIPLLVILQAAIVTTRYCVRPTAQISTETRLLIAISGVAIAAMAQYYPVPCARHIFWSLAPSFGLFVYGIWRWTGWRPLLVLILFGGAFAPMISVKTAAARLKLSQPLVTLSEPSVLRGMRTTAAEARGFELINRALQTLLQRAPETPSALIGGDALVLCFTPDRSNPSPYFVTWAGLLSAREESDRWRRILRTRPILFVQKPIEEGDDRFYGHDGYVPLLFIPTVGMTIAAPAELVNSSAK